MIAPRRLLLATTNEHKIREIRALLAGLPIDLVGLGGWAGLEAPDETGTTFAENACLKALYYTRATGLPAVGEDSGLAIDALDGAPGLESARFGGVATTYPGKFAIIYDALRRAGAPGSPARFVCAVALAEDETVVFETMGTVEGLIAPHPAGTGGFGYDPIFYYPPYGRTLAEVSAEEKAAVSHRGAAFRRLRAYFEERFA
jgi:non-canonical purine NTP pyrophosphatase (RdgB/HAM1 family)